MRRALRLTGYAFTALGVVILLFVLYELVGTTAVTKAHQSRLREEFARASPAPAATIASPALPSPPPRVAPGRAFARLRIPAIDVDVMVVEGVSTDHLAKGPGHYPDTALPGAEGAVGIAGHRTGWGAPFFDLDRLGRSDLITLETRTARYVYRVTRRTIVRPGDVWVLGGDPRSTAAHRLTLTTCTPKFTARDRLVVWADLVRGAALKPAGR